MVGKSIYYVSIPPPLTHLMFRIFEESFEVSLFQEVKCLACPPSVLGISPELILVDIGCGLRAGLNAREIYSSYLLFKFSKIYER